MELNTRSASGRVWDQGLETTCRFGAQSDDPRIFPNYWAIIIIMPFQTSCGLFEILNGRHKTRHVSVEQRYMSY